MWSGLPWPGQLAPPLPCPSVSWHVFCDKEMMALPPKTGFFLKMGTADFQSGLELSLLLRLSSINSGHA